MGTRFLFGVKIRSKIDPGDNCTTLNILKIIELYSLNQ